MNILPKSDYIAHKFHNFLKILKKILQKLKLFPTQVNPKKLKNFPKKSRYQRIIPIWSSKTREKKPALKAEEIDASLQSMGPHLEALDKYVHIVHSDFRHTRIA